MATVHDRFQVGCPCTGHLEAFATKTDAQAFATRQHRGEHHGEGHRLTVFDVMARRRSWESWWVKGYSNGGVSFEPDSWKSRRSKQEVQ